MAINCPHKGPQRFSRWFANTERSTRCPGALSDQTQHLVAWELVGKGKRLEQGALGLSTLRTRRTRKGVCVGSAVRPVACGLREPAALGVFQGLLLGADGSAGLQPVRFADARNACKCTGSMFKGSVSL